MKNFYQPWNQFLNKMHYLVDGYNFLFFYLSFDASLQKKREELIKLLDEKLTHLKIHATIIFDGFTNIQDNIERQYFNSLTVIFTAKNQTADEYIIEKLSFLKNKNEETVITADKNLAQRSKQLGAHVLSPKGFLKNILSKPTNENVEEREYEETKADIKRLLQIFENRLKENNFDI